MGRLAALLLLFPLLAIGEVNFITLKHRNAEELIPLLQPMLDEGVRISGKGPTLMINSLPWQLVEIRPLVQQLDTPLQSLLVSVIQGEESEQAQLHGNVTGTLEQPNVRLYGTWKQEQGTVSQQLRLIEGAWATISSGESIPIVSQRVTPSSNGSNRQQTIEYKDVQSGFEIRPFLRGNTVTLEVRPFRAKRSLSGAGIVEQQELTTTVSGQLGEWLSLGGVAEQQHSSATGTVYTTNDKGNTRYNVKIRVERLNH